MAIYRQRWMENDPNMGIYSVEQVWQIDNSQKRSQLHIIYV